MKDILKSGCQAAIDEGAFPLLLNRKLGNAGEYLAVVGSRSGSRIFHSALLYKGKTYDENGETTVEAMLAPFAPDAGQRFKVINLGSGREAERMLLRFGGREESNG